ncbi:hypothetical protein [Nocardioides sp. GXZ039]|uniref:hypothetical protein n=1 Tax=Nocardioides sp. GXZ039 TaxID=3136018 RepID=UPI0030F496D2
MARHTAAAQGRVEHTLYLALQAIASHHESLSIYRDEVHNVEADAQARLDQLRTIVPIAPPSSTVDA